MDYAANELEKVAKTVDEQLSGFLAHTSRQYPDKYITGKSEEQPKPRG